MRFLREDFFPKPGNVLYVLEQDGIWVAALRLTKLEDCWWLEALETKPGERRKGYASTILRDCFPYCRALGLDRILVCCKVENEASRRVIRKNGGVYEATVTEPRRGVTLERYWIDLKKEEIR